jgi:tetratricopeptide (TPR) repeat protein
VESIEPHVQQVLTLSPKNSPSAYRDGQMWDFSAARNASFELATQDWVMWLDSDDIIANPEQLAELCKAPPGTCYLLPYEYAYDAQGRCVVRQYRERLFNPRGAMHWKFPVHEVMVPVSQPLNMVQSDLVTIKHRRQYNPKPQEPERNLRILKRWMAEHPDDVRNQFYIGLEYANAGQLDDAVTWLERYVKNTGWLDEKAQAIFRLVTIHEQRRQFQKALDWAFEALKTCDWFESCYAICRQFYHLKNWERCANYARMALNTPPTKTVLFTNEADRHELHVYLNVALNQLGRTQEAYESTLEGLKGNPEHPYLRHNRAEYEKALAPKALGVVSEEVLSKAIARVLEVGKPLPAECRRLDKLDIVFVTASWERWDPESIKATGIGGSETMLANMAKHLAELGHKVTVYADPTKEGTYDGAEWRNKERFRDVDCDVLIVSRQAPYLDAPGVRARLRLLWCHDVSAIAATPTLLHRADRLLALSSWHRDFLVKAHDIHPDQVIVTRNGIDLGRFKASPPRNPYKIVNSSSPDRSWPVLLECFKRIREQVPQAELHLFYGFDNWKKVAANDPPQMEGIRLLEEQVKAPGVHYHGRVSQERLTHEFLTAGLWAYPTWFTETSCITAMEAQAAGLAVVTSNRAALGETCRYGTLLDGEWTDHEYQNKFVEACISAMATYAVTSPYSLNAGAPFSLDTLAKDWEAMFLDLLEKKKTHPLNPYLPTKPYRFKQPAKVKLNVGCGPNIFPYPGWLNYDKVVNNEYWRFMRMGGCSGMPAEQRVLAQFMAAHPDEGAVREHDWSIGFPHESGSVDYIYVGQAIEHMNRRTQTIPFLQECRRMLKPGGTLRMTTPDVKLLVDAVRGGGFAKYAVDQPEWFKSAHPADQFSYLVFGAAGPDCTQSQYEGHFHLYARESMEVALREAGFSDIAFDPPPMAEVTDAGMGHSFAVEATK